MDNKNNSENSPKGGSEINTDKISEAFKPAYGNFWNGKNAEMFEEAEEFFEYERNAEIFDEEFGNDAGYSIKENSEIHKNHRSRLRKQFLDGGIENCPDHQVLEYFLFPFIPRKDTNVIAHELINKFGSLSAVFDAEVDALRTVKGMTDVAAANIALYYKIAARINLDKAKKNDRLSTSYAVFEYVKTFMRNLKTEQAYLLCLNGNFKLIRRVLLQKGIVNQTAIYMRQIAEAALQCGATNIVIVHNHPSGNTHPSKNDIEASIEMLSIFPALEINLLDHIIVGTDEEYYSFRENELFLDTRNGVADKYGAELNDAFYIWNSKDKGGDRQKAANYKWKEKDNGKNGDKDRKR
jgi:DNA repair protein RadC